MEKKILEILLDMQSDMKNMQSDMKNMQSDMKNMQLDIKHINNRLDKIEFRMNDGFETLEMLSENNSSELTKVKIKVAKLEKRVMEINVLN
ncbi:MAG: hypothetical protein ACRCXT_05050 [Paraclostridium sp.]